MKLLISLSLTMIYKGKAIIYFDSAETAARVTNELKSVEFDGFLFSSSNE
jgi:hypothetical protein